MACNCATSEQLNEIYRKFGTKIKASANEKTIFRVKNFFMNFFALTTLITAVPLVALSISFNYSHGNNKISLTDFFELRADKKALEYNV